MDEFWGSLEKCEAFYKNEIDARDAFKQRVKAEEKLTNFWPPGSLATWLRKVNFGLLESSQFILSKVTHIYQAKEVTQARPNLVF